jgi:DNA-binding XRE family transcriptional regulator
MCKSIFRDFAKEITEDLIIEAKEKGYSIEDLAELIGSSKHTILNYLYDEKIPSLSAFIGLWRKTKPEKTLRKLASWSGYAAFKLPEINEDAFPILSKKTALTLKEFSEFVDSIGDAAYDGRITKAEVQKIEREGMEAIEKILETIETARRLAR